MNGNQHDGIVTVYITIIQVLMWINGKPVDHMFKVHLDESINSLRRLKEKISDKIGKFNYERSKIYNYKGLELDDNDIQYLENHDSLYISLDGKLGRLICRS
jgi:hypothetical protein